jgi:hypothetical protein
VIDAAKLGGRLVRRAVCGRKPRDDAATGADIFDVSLDELGQRDCSRPEYSMSIR